MKKGTSYTYNPKTLLFEEQHEAWYTKALRVVGYIATVAAFAVAYFFIYTSVLGLDLPKTAYLKKQNDSWRTRYEVLNYRMNLRERELNLIEQRDDDVYRNIFGLDEIPQEVKNAGYGGVNRYSYLEDLGADDYLKSTVMKADHLTKRICVQSMALDEITLVSKQADVRNSCVPSIPPIVPQKGAYRVSSPYGRRHDPVYKGRVAFHDGVDFATGKVGPGIYATGDGVVEKVKYQFYGYGNEVVVNHGFGYKTRYAHMNSIDVHVGQKVVRGTRLGEVGNTGKSTGPHLHYEIMFRNKPTDPMSYMDLTMEVADYHALIESVNEKR